MKDTLTKIVLSAVILVPCGLAMINAQKCADWHPPLTYPTYCEVYNVN